MACLIIGDVDHGYYLADLHGTPVRACWFDSVEDAEIYCEERGLDVHGAYDLADDAEF